MKISEKFENFGKKMKIQKTFIFVNFKKKKKARKKNYIIKKKTIKF